MARSLERLKRATGSGEILAAEQPVKAGQALGWEPAGLRHTMWSPWECWGRQDEFLCLLYRMVWGGCICMGGGAGDREGRPYSCLKPWESSAGHAYPLSLPLEQPQDPDLEGLLQPD